MKLTAKLLRQIISEEARKPKAPQSRNLSAEELRHIIVTEAAKLTSTSLLSEDIATLQGIVDDKVILKRKQRRSVGGPPPGDVNVDTGEVLMSHEPSPILMSTMPPDTGADAKAKVGGPVQGALDPRDIGRKDRNPDFLDYSKIPTPAELTKKAADLSKNSFGTLLSLGRVITSKLDHFARGIKIIDDANSKDQLRLLMKAYRVQEGLGDNHLDKDLQAWLDEYSNTKNKKVQKLMKDLKALQQRINLQMKKEKIHLPTSGRDVRGYNSTSDRLSRYNYGLNESRILTEASKVDQVKAVQQALMNLGYDVGKTKDDGDYGPATAKAVVAFQTAQGWGQKDIDARVGPKTAAALIKAVKAKKAPAEKPAEEKKAPAEKPAEPEQVITPEEVPNLGPVQAAEEEETPRRGLDRSKRGYKRFLEKEGTRKAISQGLDDLVSNKVVKSVNGALHVISTLKDDDGEPGKRMSTLHATLEDIVKGSPGGMLKTEYDRLRKGYRKLIKRTQAGNRDKMRAELSKKALDGAKDAREKLGLG
jgi:hypothetical protein